MDKRIFIVVVIGKYCDFKGISSDLSTAGVIEETTSSIDQTVLIAVICVIVGILFLMSLAFALYCIISFIRGRRYVMPNDCYGCTYVHTLCMCVYVCMCMHV